MKPKLLKKLVAPMQTVLLQRGLCPACTRRLDDQKNRDPRSNGTTRVQCECGRVYIYEDSSGSYRRALIEEA